MVFQVQRPPWLRDQTSQAGLPVFRLWLGDHQPSRFVFCTSRRSFFLGSPCPASSIFSLSASSPTEKLWMEIIFAQWLIYLRLEKYQKWSFMNKFINTPPPAPSFNCNDMWLTAADNTWSQCRFWYCWPLYLPQEAQILQFQPRKHSLV